ncbi:MAG: MFS transporter [Gammaproteobacteria bacterium]|nr:MFS transporter [Gammaproteobacteria bacterium]
MNEIQAKELPGRRWLVLLGLSLTYASTNGILLHTLPIMYPHLMETFGWTQSQVTLPATFFFAIGAITSPPAGGLLDRFSPRWIIITGLLGIIVALFAYAAMTQLWQLIVIYSVFAVSLSLSGLVSNMLVLSRWFVKLRGRATGILLMSSSAGGAVFPLLLGFFLVRSDWRVAMQLMAVVVACCALVPIMLFVRDRPATQPKAGDREVDVHHGPAVAKALREPRFYLLALSTGILWFTIVSIVQHQSIYLSQDMGIDKQLLPPIFSIFFACSIIGKLLFGWLSDRFDKTLMMLASMAMLALGLVLLRNVTLMGNISLFGYAIVAGTGFAGVFTMIQLLFANFYAGSSFGKILALLMLVDTLAGALGIRVLAIIRETSGSYLGGIDLMIGLLCVAFVCILTACRTNVTSIPVARS